MTNINDKIDETVVITVIIAYLYGNNDGNDRVLFSYDDNDFVSFSHVTICFKSSMLVPHGKSINLAVLCHVSGYVINPNLTDATGNFCLKC